MSLLTLVFRWSARRGPQGHTPAVQTAVRNRPQQAVRARRAWCRTRSKANARNTEPRADRKKTALPTSKEEQNLCKQYKPLVVGCPDAGSESSLGKCRHVLSVTLIKHWPKAIPVFQLTARIPSQREDTRELRQRPCRSAASCLALHGLLNLLSYKTQAHGFTDDTTHMPTG